MQPKNAAPTSLRHRRNRSSTSKAKPRSLALCKNTLGSHHRSGKSSLAIPPIIRTPSRWVSSLQLLIPQYLRNGAYLHDHHEAKVPHHLQQTWHGLIWAQHKINQSARPARSNTSPHRPRNDGKICRKPLQLVVKTRCSKSIFPLTNPSSTNWPGKSMKINDSLWFTSRKQWFSHGKRWVFTSAQWSLQSLEGLGDQRWYTTGRWWLWSKAHPHVPATNHWFNQPNSWLKKWLITNNMNNTG